MLKNYACLDYDGQVQQTHYRASGSGPPLILLHPSPLSSAFMVPLINLFDEVATVFAPDTPGYGASDPLPDPGQDLSAYVDWLRRFMLSQGLTSAGIYGSATGAQIAIQFARTYPEMADYVVLDNAVHFTNEERQRIMKNYFPDLTPQSNGSHFQAAWDMSAKLYRYFPWFDQSDDCKVSDTEPPVELVNGTAMSYLVAGINHLAWFLELKRNGEDLYPALRKVMDDLDSAKNVDWAKQELVRFEIMRQFGYFPTESSPHDSEYMPYFRKSPELMEHFNLKPRDVPDEQPENRPWMLETSEKTKTNIRLAALRPSKCSLTSHCWF